MTSSKILFVICIIIAVIFIAPFLTIWSLNTLFPALEISYTIETWAAIILLQLAIRPNFTSPK
jgi:hypothetical protein